VAVYDFLHVGEKSIKKCEEKHGEQLWPT